MPKAAAAETEDKARVRVQQSLAQRMFQIANIRWIIEKARDFQKNIYFCKVVSNSWILATPLTVAC